MTKTYYIVSYKVNGKQVYWGTAKELSYVDGTTDIFKARWYENIKNAKITVNDLKYRNNGTNTYTNVKLFEYTVEITVNREIEL